MTGTVANAAGPSAALNGVAGRGVMYPVLALPLVVRNEESADTDC